MRKRIAGVKESPTFALTNLNDRFYLPLQKLFISPLFICKILIYRHIPLMFF